MDSWFREICSTSLACLFSDREKNRVYFGSIGARFWRQPPTLPLYYEGNGDEDYLPQNYVYVLRTTTPRHVVSFIDFYFPFLAKFQT